MFKISIIKSQAFQCSQNVYNLEFIVINKQKIVKFTTKDFMADIFALARIFACMY